MRFLNPYQAVRLRIWLTAVLLFVPVWFSYALVKRIVRYDEPLPATVRVQLLSNALHLMKAADRDAAFAGALEKIISVDSAMRLKIFEGPKIALWYRRLNYSERDRLMKAVLPPAFLNLLQKWAGLPPEEQADEMIEYGLRLMKSGKVPEVLRKELEQFDPAKIHEYRIEMVRRLDALEKEGLYHEVLELIVQQLCGGELRKDRRLMSLLISGGLLQSADHTRSNSPE